MTRRDQRARILFGATALVVAGVAYTFYHRARKTNPSLPDTTASPTTPSTASSVDALRVEFSSALAAAQANTADPSALMDLASRLATAGLTPEAVILQREANRIGQARAATSLRQELLVMAMGLLATVAASPDLIAVQELRNVSAELRNYSDAEAVRVSNQLAQAADRLERERQAERVRVYPPVSPITSAIISAITPGFEVPPITPGGVLVPQRSTGPSPFGRTFR